MKNRINVSVDSDVHEAAKAFNINVSATLNRALRDEIRRHAMAQTLLDDSSPLRVALRDAASTHTEH